LGRPVEGILDRGCSERIPPGTFGVDPREGRLDACPSVLSGHDGVLVEELGELSQRKDVVSGGAALDDGRSRMGGLETDHEIGGSELPRGERARSMGIELDAERMGGLDDPGERRRWADREQAPGANPDGEPADALSQKLLGERATSPIRRADEDDLDVVGPGPKACHPRER
jgi:hypothetical protein